MGVLQMTDANEQNKLWDEFLGRWPLSKLATMTLSDYTQAGSKDTFTYWIESRLDKLGSIWGGSAFKFGVFSRKDLEARQTGEKLSYSDSHAWYSALGTTANEAFLKVRSFIVQVAEMAAKGDLDGIESIEVLGEAYKWKIAFHYQDRNSPSILCIFKAAILSAFVGDPDKRSMAELQKAAIGKRPSSLDIVEFSRLIWTQWGEKNILIWKVSHGGTDIFTDDERQKYLDDKLAVVHGETAVQQGAKFKEVPIGSLFYLCHGNSLQLIGQFTSIAAPCAKGVGWLQREYRVLQQVIRTDSYSENSKKWSPRGNSTFWQVPPNDRSEFERTLLKPFFGIGLAELATMAGEVTEEAVTNQTVIRTAATRSRSTMPINEIYYGPPGTGKTYAVVKLLKENYERSATTTTAEEWRSQLIAEKIGTLKWWEGIAAALYDLGGKSTVGELLQHPFLQAIALAKGRKRNVRENLRGVLQDHAVENSTTVNLQRRSSPLVFDKTVDTKWFLAGEWEDTCEDLTALVDQLNAGPKDAGSTRNYRFVTFHQSYGYEEFVEGLRPVLANEGEASEVQYEIRPGVFKQLCDVARSTPSQRFAMVIDEINRGNISKIFGELITLIEPDKREGAEHAVSVLLPYSGESFSVPANVDIVGTMNTADRSLALLDTALRRRFDFIPVMPDARDLPDAPLHGLRVAIGGRVIDVPKLLTAINERVEALYDRDHTIGHAYFTALGLVADGEERFRALNQLLRNRILPLLEEYFFEDWHKICLVLGDNQKSKSARFVIETKDQEEDLYRLFGNDHGLDAFATKRRYVVQEEAFANADAYIGIYQAPES
jgi:5-methylcytosine-specific restriction enzyme B